LIQLNMEIMHRMSKRFAWLIGLVGLVVIGLLVACGTTYNSSSDGLVLTSSQGSALMETFSYSLANGHIAAVANSPSSTSNKTCVLPGIPSSIVLDPAGAYAYVIFNSSTVCSGSKTGIAAFKVNSDGTLTSVGSLTADPSPVVLAMDSAGKFLFVAEGLNSVPTAPKPIPCPGTTAQFGVCVYSIGSGGSLTPVPGTFTFTGQIGFQTPNLAALAPTPTVLPGNGINGIQNSVCSDPGNSPPTSEYLYVADSANSVVWQLKVNTSSGALTGPIGTSPVVAGTVPAGVAVDPCARFVYVSNMTSNNISAYTICNGLTTQSSTCSGLPPWALAPVTGSPFSLPSSGNGPGPLLVDPFGKSLYVLETLSSQVTPFTISQVSGSLTAGTSVATGIQPTSMAIRGDDNWLFVANFQSATLSQYSIIPSSGVLSPLPAVTTDNNPWGVAVK
jgi:6-phosphogluconolactonase (cycloisomerase 2 family)